MSDDDSQNQKKQQITLQISTWRQLQNGLFDYRTERHEQQKCFSSSIIYLQLPPINTSVYYIIHQPLTYNFTSLQRHRRLERRKKLKSTWDGNGIASEYKIMGAFQIINEKGTVFVEAFAAKEIKQEYQRQEMSKMLPYWVVRTFSNWIVNVGQILKFGRMELLVNEVSVGSNENEVNEEQQQQQQQQDFILNVDQKIQASHLQSNNQQQKRCKVCYTTQAQQPNRILITPCKCKGSIRYVHVDCLKQWLMNRLTKVSLQRNGEIKIKDKECCQVCKARYPMKILKNGRAVPVFSFIEQAHFISFQSANEHEGEIEFYVSFEGQKQVKIGRLQESNGLLLSDQTASRNHAILQIQNKQCILKDQESKYGTLVYAKGKKVRIVDSLRAFQIQNSVYCFKLR